MGVAVLLLAAPFCPYSLLPLAFYALLVCLDAAVQNRSLRIGVYSIAAAFIQLTGYGTGFLRAWWHRCVRGRGEMEAFRTTFYNDFRPFRQGISPCFVRSFSFL